MKIIKRQLKISSSSNHSVMLIRINDKYWETAPEFSSFVVTVKVKDRGFAGENKEVVIAKDHYNEFLAKLKTCDLERKGQAILTAISPIEFQLIVENFDQIGHFSLKYHLNRYSSINFNRNVEYKVTGEFELESSTFTQLVNSFANLVKR